VSGLIIYILLASGLRSTTYGWGELMCGDVGHPVRCTDGAVTASGDVFDTSIPTMAVSAPVWLVTRSKVVPVKIDGGKCVYIRVNDKMNPRYIGERGFDLSPAAVRLVTGAVPTSTWSGRITICYDLLLDNITTMGKIKWNLNIEQGTGLNLNTGRR